MKRTFLFLFLIVVNTLVTAKPTSSKSTSASSADKLIGYTIKQGDSLYSISRQFHTSIKTLEELNSLSPGALLRPGQKLKVPGVSTGKTAVTKKGSAEKSKRSASGAKKSSLYKVEAGDTLSLIAQRFGIGTEELRKANGMEKGSLIRVGQLLKIPGQKTTSKATSSAPKERSATGKKKKTAQKSGKAKDAKATAAKAKAGDKTYTVQSGDTLFSIARKYHTPLNDLMTLNGIAPTDIIKPGQELKIPAKSYKASATSRKKPSKKVTKKSPKKVKKVAPVYYTVKHGDTLWKIADRHGITLKELRKLNRLKRGHVIHSGQKLMVKAGTPETKVVAKKKSTVKKTKKVPQYYTVKRGDSLWKIARQHKLTVKELRELNKLGKNTLLHRGMKLTVGYKEEAATKVAKKKKAPEKRVATKSRKKKSKKVASAAKSKKRGKKSANKRINSAMAALNGKGGSGGHYSSSEANRVIRTAKRYLGRRYVWGAEGPSSFDCSGFTQYVMKKSKGVKLPRVSRKQAYYGKYVTFSHLRPGDLIFFDTSRRRRGYVNHVGIYIGNGKFIHASSARHRVVITSFKSSPFYRARFKWGRRVN